MINIRNIFFIPAFLFLIQIFNGCLSFDSFDDFTTLEYKNNNPKKTTSNDKFCSIKKSPLNSFSSINSIPIGYFDGVNENGGYGWAVDKDAGSSPIDVHIYINGQFYKSITANESRTDVQAAGYSNDPNHGFSFSTTDLPAGKHNIQVWAIDHGGSNNIQLQHSPKSLTVTEKFIGNFDSADSNGGYGWAYDPAAKTAPVSVNIYVNGAFNQTVLANRVRHDLVSKGVAPNSEHGFLFSLSGLLPGQYEIDAYGVKYLSNEEVKLNNQPIIVNILQVQNSIPFGKVEVLTENGCSGWVYDNDLGSNAASVRVFIDGNFYKQVNADVSRNDLVANGQLNTPNHGFNINFIGLLPGSHSVTVFAVDNLSQNNIEIENSYGSINVPNMALPDLIPLELTWTPLNPKPGQNVMFNLKVKNTGNSSTLQNVMVMYEIEGSSFVTYGMSGQLQAGELSNSFESMMVWNVPAEGNYNLKATIDPNLEIDELNEGNNIITGFLNVQNNQNKTVYTWDPLIQNECYSVYTDPPQWIEEPLGPDCIGGDSAKRWMFGTTNEDINFQHGSMHSFPISSPVWNFAFNNKSDGTNQIGWVIDKVNNQLFLDRYTFAGFTDSWDVNGPLKPVLGKDVFVDLNVALMAQEQYNDQQVGLAKNRIMVGAVARWGNPERAHYLEINLWRTENFDLCTSSNCNSGGCCPTDTCDTQSGQGIYDRRFNCDQSMGHPEGVYFYGPTLDRVVGTSLPALSVNGVKKQFHIPLAQLYRNYSWADPPSSWDNIELAGIYIGIEVWGKGRVWMEFDGYECYSND